MSDSLLAVACAALAAALDGVAAAAHEAGDDELVALLGDAERASRRLDAVSVATVAALERRGVLAARGYGTPAAALADLLRCERPEARRRATAAEAVVARTALDGTHLPPRLPATAEAFAAGDATLRHVEAIATVLDTPAAERLSPDVWAAAEAELAEKATEYTPAELRRWGTALVDLLDDDDPDDRAPEPVIELHLTRLPGGGGRIKGRFDDPAVFAAIATVVDAGAAPRTADDDRPAGRRRAEALADACGYVLDHGDLPASGGHRPHLTVTIPLAELEARARGGLLDLGDTLSPAALRLLACDASVVPVVLGGRSQPLDVGRATRTVPDGLRRAVAARDGGCAHPGCDRPPSWCEVHHIREWQHGGETEVDNLVMLCRAHHRQVHTTDWVVRIRDGTPEFVPPRWIDGQQRPRRTPDRLLATA